MRPVLTILIVGVILGVGAGVVATHPRAEAATIAADAAPVVTDPRTRDEWAVALAQALGNDAPTADTIAFLVAWSRAEDGSDGALSRNNPWNTTQEDSSVTAVINGDGVKGYQTAQDGLRATVTTLGYSYPGYTDIAAGIATNDPERALRGLYASPWGTHAGLVETIYHELHAAQPAAPLPPSTTDGPSGNPLNDPRTVLTQGYGVGSHAPAATWGGVDLAWPDVYGAPVYATMAGEARQSTTATCGNGVEILAPGWRVLYCHLSAFGQAGMVERGAIVGYVGATGAAQGAHLHYENWQGGVNVDPCLRLEGIC